MSETGKEYGEFLKERRQQKEAGRINYAKSKLEERGIVYIYNENVKALEFVHKGCIIRLYPYTGWFSGRSVKGGRGLENLLKQIV